MVTIDIAPEDVILLKLTNSTDCAIVDADMCHLSSQRWYLLNTGYVATNGNVLLHRVVFGDTVMVVDHINRNPLDNRRCNLREVTRSQNMFNTNNEQKGIYPTESGRYRVGIKVNGKQTYLGTFDTYDEALAVRLAALEEARQ